MVVVDSSALIPLSWIGRLDLIADRFEERHTTEEVEDEVLRGGKRGTTALQAFLDDVTIHPTPDEVARMAELEGITTADASVILVADHLSDVLLANDKGLIEVARTQGTECWWVTTLLLRATKNGSVEPPEAHEILYDLVDSGMNLHPKVYARVQQTLDEIGK